MAHVWFWKFLRHPLFIAFISTCVFGIVVAAAGSKLQYSSWKKQQRAELAAKVFYLNKRRETNVWCYHAACQFPEKFDRLKYWEISLEMKSEAHSLRQHLLIFFGQERELIDTVVQIHNMWDDIELKLSDDIGCKELTKEFIQQKSNEAFELERKILKVFTRILYR